MITGYTFLSIALVLTVAANVLFVLSRRTEKETLFRVARLAVLGATGGVVLSALYLMQLIATHQFQVAYVAEYSAKRAAPGYLLAAFWGGQEGSLLLWGFWTAILGTILAWRSGSREQCARVWPVYGVVQTFLLSLLLVKCPFALGTGPVPLDGKGLNPLLENMWMVIHPPILFLGFASTLVPFAWCVQGLLFRDWDNWTKRAFPWTLFSFATLGLGLSLGGYWAYETLGWGGFWGWDPVENSSLVPWLFLTALLHGIAIQNKNGGFKITNFVLGFLPFAAMFYGTFLTRTGLLSDFSVHSFSSLGQNGFYILLSGLLTSVVLPLGFLFLRLREIPKPPAYEKVTTREFGYFVAASTLGLLGLLVCVGMSAPLITKLWMTKGAAAQPEFYNQGGYPLAIILTLGMAMTPYLAWKASNTSEVGKRLFPSYLAAIVLAMAMAGGAIFMGVKKPWMIVLFASSAFAIVSNAVLIVPRLRRRESRRTVGGFVAHMGAGLTLVGVACLVAFSQKAERVVLVRDRPVQALGFTLTYKGQTAHQYDRDHNALRVRVEKNGRVWDALPRYYVAPWNGEDSNFANPPAILPSVYNLHRLSDIANFMPWNNPLPSGDVYIAHSGGPESFDDTTGVTPNTPFTLKVGETRTLGDYKFTYRGWQFDPAAEAAQTASKTDGGAAFKALPQIFLRAAIEVSYQNGPMQVVIPQTRMEHSGGAFAVPAPVPGPEGRAVMLKLDAPTAEFDPRVSVTLRTLNAPDPTETILVDISTKPFISLVWLGTLLYTIGGIVAYRRRAYELGIMGSDANESNADKGELDKPAVAVPSASRLALGKTGGSAKNKSAAKR